MTSTFDRKAAIRNHFDQLADSIATWKSRNRYYHESQEDHLRYIVEKNKRVLEIGCGNGTLLAALEPIHGIGIDLSRNLIDIATATYPSLQFEVADAETWEPPESVQFDYIVLSDLVGYLDDIQICLRRLHRVCHENTRLVISSYNFLWQPVLAVAEHLGLKMPTPAQSWVSMDDLRNLLYLSDYQIVKSELRLLFPKYVPLVSWIVNHLGNLPIINHACLCQYVVARPGGRTATKPLSASIVIPCRNERGNIRAAVNRLPHFGTRQEIIFVDGHSTDGTQSEIEKVIQEFPARDIHMLTQAGRGKGDAVRMGFSAARGDVLMILDSDLTVPPEDLPKFFEAIASSKGDFLNGCRLIYPMEDQAMRALNQVGNKFFAACFSWLLGQRLKDTLCGTKVLLKSDYETISANRSYFGEFDPFGDFDLLFGASKLNLKIIEIPVRYRSRTYGETKIHRFRHGLILLQMVVFAYRKMKSM